MNSYTAVEINKGKYAGRIVTVGATCLTDAMNRIAYELRKNPSRIEYFKRWESNGCPVIEFGNEDNIFYLNHDQPTPYNRIINKVKEDGRSPSALLQDSVWISRTADELSTWRIPARFFIDLITSTLTIEREYE